MSVFRRETGMWRVVALAVAAQLFVAGSSWWHPPHWVGSDAEPVVHVGCCHAHHSDVPSDDDDDRHSEHDCPTCALIVGLKLVDLPQAAVVGVEHDRPIGQVCLTERVATARAWWGVLGGRGPPVMAV